MTVAELRKKLEKFPDDLVVISSVMDGEPIKDVKQAIRQTVVMIT